MKLRNQSLIGAVLGASMLFAVPANATLFTLSNVNISLQTVDPGLVVAFDSVVSTPHDENLNVGDSTTFDLFRIYTNETAVNADDTVAKPISVILTFSAPDNFNDTITGDTVGGTIFLFQGGAVQWDGSVDFLFGSGGILRVTLSDEIFNVGFLGINEGASHGAFVQATLQYIQAPTETPEPSPILLIGVALAGLGLYQLRQRKQS